MGFGSLVGTCEGMCPQSELRTRLNQDDFSALERPSPFDDRPPEALAVKRFARTIVSRTSWGPGTCGPHFRWQACSYCSQSPVISCELLTSLQYKAADGGQSFPCMSSAQLRLQACMLQVAGKADDFRTKAALLQTQAHLQGIMDRPLPLHGMFQFVWERFRSMRQDMYVQGMQVCAQ